MDNIVDFPGAEEEQHEPDKPSYYDVLKMANALTKTSDPGQVSEVLKAAAMAELDPVPADMILGATRPRWHRDDPRRRPGEDEAAQEAAT